MTIFTTKQPSSKQPSSKKKPDWKARLDSYHSGGFNTINGWVHQSMFHTLGAVQHAHDVLDIHGSLIEIGVHHGRFFFALDQLRRQGESAFAIDVFEDQDLNIDQSGKGSRKMFEKHLKRHGQFPDSTNVICKDSTQIDDRFVSDLLADGRCRLLSIDGGHTPEHTVNDLRIAQRVLGNGGVVFLDDFFSAFWPGVHEGFSRFMLFDTPTIVPFGTSGGKLFMTTLSTHEKMLHLYHEYMSRFEHMKIKSVKIFGYDVVAAAHMPK